MRDDGGGHGELDGGGVDDADHVARPGCLEDAEEGPVETVLGVQLHDLLVVVGALEQLDPGVERPAVSLEEDFDGVDHWVERVGTERATLDRYGRGHRLGGRVINIVGEHVGDEGELDLANVADSNCVWATGGLNGGAEGAELAVLDVHAHLAWGVVWSVPELDVRVERAALGGQDDLHLFNHGGAVRPCAEGAALNNHGGVRLQRGQQQRRVSRAAQAARVP